MTVRPRCRICEQAASLTDEDIIPTWMRSHLIASRGPFAGQAPRRIKTRICRACNETLGRMFEANASAAIRPLIDGESVVLSPDGQIQVASWLTKTSLLGNLAGSEPDSWGEEKARRCLQQMMKAGRPPLQTYVRLGRVDMSTQAPHHRTTLTGILPRAERMPKCTFFSVWTIGDLAFEVLVGTFQEMYSFANWADRQPVRHFVRIWPKRTRPVPWPPRALVSRDLLEAMRAAHFEARRTDMDLPDPWRRDWDLPSADG